jgi:uncharacterized membrane protein
MSAWVELLRWIHVIGACVLLGTGAGIAFFMLMAHRTRSPAIIAHVAGSVVVADLLFTATAVVVQPITGALLAHLSGWSLTTPWILLSVALYVLTGLCWLPVVLIQLRIRNLARGAVAKGTPLGEHYEREFRTWFMLGWPAFASVLAIVWLMVARPSF